MCQEIILDRDKGRQIETKIDRKRDKKRLRFNGNISLVYGRECHNQEQSESQTIPSKKSVGKLLLKYDDEPCDGLKDKSLRKDNKKEEKKI